MLKQFLIMDIFSNWTYFKVYIYIFKVYSQNIPAQDLMTIWMWIWETELVKDNSQCLDLNNRAYVAIGAFSRTDGGLWEKQVEGIMSSVPDMQYLRFPLAIQAEAFMRLGLAFKTRALGEIPAGVRS